MTGKQKKWISSKSLQQLTAWKESGLSDKQIADNMGISRSTLCNWKRVFPEINNALLDGEAPAVEAVENSLYKLAKGFEYTETKTIEENRDGTITTRTETTTKYCKPDTTAIIFILTNRMSDKWKRNNDNVQSEADRPLNKLELFTNKNTR